MVGLINKIIEKEYVFDYGRKMMCPHCKEDITYIKGYFGTDEGIKTTLFGSKMKLYAMVFLCPKCEIIINVQQVGTASNLLGG